MAGPFLDEMNTLGRNGVAVAFVAGLPDGGTSYLLLFPVFGRCVGMDCSAARKAGCAALSRPTDLRGPGSGVGFGPPFRSAEAVGSTSNIFDIFCGLEKIPINKLILSGQVLNAQSRDTFKFT